MSEKAETTKKVKNDELKTYELAYLLSPLVAADAVAEAVNTEIKHWLKKAGAEVKSEVAPYSRELAYKIKKVVEHKGSTFREAYFGAIYFTCEPGQMPMIEEGLKKSALIIRHLIMILPNRAFLPPAKPRVARAEAGAPETPSPASASPVATSNKMTEAAIDQEIDQLLVTPSA